MKKDKKSEVYRDGRYVLGREDGVPYMTAAGEKFTLSCHPYEPCLYITDKNGNMTAVHNAFDPSSVLWAFSKGMTVTSITGREYDALDFCKMVEYAEGMFNIGIDEAEKVFGDSPKKKNPEPKKNEEKPPVGEKPPRPEADLIISDEKVASVLKEYPDIVVDYCIVKNEEFGRGRNAHWFALLWASRALFIDDDDEVIWRSDVAKADGVPIGTGELFAPVAESGKLNYRTAFLRPPHENGYTNADFARVNTALFPKGTDGLEVYSWTTDWTEYFDEGREWWGTLCLTVYDKNLDRYVVIMASATD